MSADAAKAEVNLGVSVCRDGLLQVDGVGRRVIQTPKPEPRITHYELINDEWTANQTDAAEQTRGVAHAKLAANDLAFIPTASIRPWLRIREAAP